MGLLSVLSSFLTQNGGSENGAGSGLGGILQSLLGSWANPGCWGASSYQASDFDREKKFLSDELAKGFNYPNDLAIWQMVLQQYTIVRDQKLRHMPNLNNACSKQRTQAMIDLTQAQLTRFNDWLNIDPYNKFSVDQWGENYSIPKLISFKMMPSNDPPTQPPYYPPTNPPTQPPYYPPTNPPTNPPTTEPPYYPPTTEPPYYPPTTQPNNPPTSTVDPNKVTYTTTINPDGSQTRIFYKGGVYWRTQTIPASSLGTSNLTGDPIDINGQIGDWTFGVNNGSNQNMMLALGGVGVLGVIYMMTKKKS